MIASHSSKIFGRRKHWACIGGKFNTSNSFALKTLIIFGHSTWVLTTEDVLEPPVRLAEECKKIGIAEGDFVTCNIGETRVF